MRGEFKSMSLLYSLKPNFVPKSRAWGTYHSFPQLHFFPADIHDLDGEKPGVDAFTTALAELHKASLPLSPGKYGFDVPTHMGFIEQDNS
ncbi:hypothetical protein V8C42DRAFT_331592 [Trichoderma barbatum]